MPERAGLFEHGDVAAHFFLLLEGQIKLYRLSPNGNEKVIEFVRPGESFAEAIMLMDKQVYPVSAMALTDSRLIRIDSREFIKLLRSSVDTCFVLMAEMSKRIRGLINEIDDLSLHSATCRVSAYLVQCMEEQDSRKELRLNVPKSLVASRLSVKPETFSRILKSLSSSGAIDVEGDKVRIHDENKLREAAECSLESLKGRAGDQIVNRAII